MFIWTSIIIIAFWWITKYHSQKGNIVSSVQDNLEKDSRISEERVFEIQNDFEKKLENTYLPDAITHRDLYKYRYLMRDWYDQLAGKNRYDEKMAQQLRSDWIDYMEALEDRSTYNFLSLEATKEEKTESYREKHIIASRKAFAIEQAFASAIGEDAVKKLKEIRDKESWVFNKEGEMAPDGHTFDFRGELRKEKKH